MQTIRARNINDVWPKAKLLLLQNHVLRPSRNGSVIECPEPVTTIYAQPCERVLFDPVRDANPFFHFHEFLWMIAGRRDVKWLSQFNSRISQFSDNGEIFAGAYGFRWRNWFEMPGGGPEDDTDQLPKIIRMLKANRDERRAVLTMWDPTSDLEVPTCKDLPCNTQIYFYVRPYNDTYLSPRPLPIGEKHLVDKLDMTVCCRSNDIIWGCYGANVVHMSMLHEYMATMIGVPVGTYRQISNSWHAYSNVWEQYTGLPVPPAVASEAVLEGLVRLASGESTSSAQRTEPGDAVDPYQAGLRPRQMVLVPETWDDELYNWMEMTEGGAQKWVFKNPFFSNVATPLYRAWTAWKANQSKAALDNALNCAADDWRVACHNWLERRINARKAKAELGG